MRGTSTWGGLELDASQKSGGSAIYRARRDGSLARPSTRRPRARARGFYAAVGIAVVCLGVGCSRSDRPPLGRVGGTVTLDGVPLAGALVVFTPDGPGRSAIATTDTAGRYELSFLRDIAGANVGTHTVRITTATEDRGGKEILPDRYHVNTELTAKVESGTNAIDFPLQSK